MRALEIVVGVSAVAQVAFYMYPSVEQPWYGCVFIDSEPYLWYGACVRRECESTATERAVLVLGPSLLAAYAQFPAVILDVGIELLYVEWR